MSVQCGTMYEISSWNLAYEKNYEGINDNDELSRFLDLRIVL